MSYILDALKKSQSEQAAEGVALRVQQVSERSHNPWLVAVLSIVLLCNAGLFGWIFLMDEVPQSAAPATSLTPPSRPAAESRQSQQVQRKRRPQPTTRPQPETQPEAQPVIETVALADLPLAEQTIYNGFTYSTHIYTDDPSLCVIVVDGQRLTAGDSFKGLSVVAISETGVIFEENRRGQLRRVDVSVIDQWAN